MTFDINRYDKVRFDKDELTHKRIKALLLWFEYEVHQNETPLSAQIKLMDKWMEKLVKQEYYEVIPFFTAMRTDMINLNNDRKEAIMSEITAKAPFLTRVKYKINKLYTKLFKKK